MVQDHHLLQARTPLDSTPESSKSLLISFLCSPHSLLTTCQAEVTAAFMDNKQANCSTKTSLLLCSTQAQPTA